MRTICILILFLALNLDIKAQHVFASTGKDISNSSIKISYTIGEPLVSKISNSSISLSNGFQNATNITITAIKNNLFGSNELLIYPNPTKSNLFIENKSNKTNLSYYLYSINGNEILHYDFNNQPQQIIDINYIASGLYLLEIIDNNTLQSQTYKIEKSNN